MKISNLAKYALTITTGAAILAACSNNGGSTLAPSGASAGTAGIAHIGRAVMLEGVLITAAHPNLSAHHLVRSQPRRSMKSGFYQYVANFGYGNGTILEFDYPKGDVSIGSLPFSGGLCTRNGKGTFWVASSELAEFTVGGSSPIRVLKGGGGGCAIDRATGDIAASDLSSGGIIIFRHARGKGRVYSSGLSEAFFEGYDDRGNLFLDGFNDSGAFGLVELPKGSSGFEPITTSNNVEFPGAVQWDGKYLTIGDQDARAIYQYTVSGTTATFEGAVSLSGSADCVQTWIAKTIVFCPDAGNDDTTVYKYPAGGYPIATLTGSFYLPLAAVQVAK
ncbi:MAG: hypothetical protein WA431_15370 [Candidatus Cybelea sp.]